MAKAMVSTVRPKARATPTKPMPKAGKAAASTAEPHPPKTSQAVPMNSAASLRVMTHPPFCYPWVEPYARHKTESPPPPGGLSSNGWRAGPGFRRGRGRRKGRNDRRRGPCRTGAALGQSLAQAGDVAGVKYEFGPLAA